MVFFSLLPLAATSDNAAVSERTRRSVYSGMNPRKMVWGIVALLLLVFGGVFVALSRVESERAALIREREALRQAEMRRQQQQVQQQQALLSAQSQQQQQRQRAEAARLQA